MQCEFAISNLVNSSTGMSPFEADLGYTPIFSPLGAAPSAAPAASITPAAVSGFLQHQAKTFERVRDSILQAQHDALAADDNNNVRRIPPPAVGSLVLVSSEALLSPAQRGRPSRKLAFPWQGPFKVLATPSPSTVRLELPRN